MVSSVLACRHKIVIIKGTGNNTPDYKILVNLNTLFCIDMLKLCQDGTRDILNHLHLLLDAIEIVIIANNDLFDKLYSDEFYLLFFIMSESELIKRASKRNKKKKMRKMKFVMILVVKIQLNHRNKT